MAIRPVKVAFWQGYKRTLIPRGAVADTSGGANGHLGYVGSSFFTIPEGPSRLVVGFRFVTSGGSFDVIGTGAEDAEAELKFTCYRVFENGGDEQQKFSVSPAVDVADGSWSGTAGARFDRPVLLTPGRYRLDLEATLSEDYEFDAATLPDVDWTIVTAKFRDHFGAELPNGLKGICLQAYTSYNLTTGAAGETDYEFDEDEVPLACDISTYPISMPEWVEFLISRVANGMRQSWLPGNYRQLLNESGWRDSESMRADNVYGGGMVEKQQTLQEAATRILFEIGGVFDWSGPAYRMFNMPTTSSPPLDRVISIDDLVRRSEEDPLPDLSIRWTKESACWNLIDARYLRDYSQNQGDRESYQSAAPRKEDTESLGKIGQQMNAPKFWFDWIRAEADATESADRWLQYYGQPKRVATFRGFLNLLELERGDIIAFNLTPVITVGGDPIPPDDPNQAYGEGAYGEGAYGGAQTIPEGTIIGETFGGLTSSVRFMIETRLVNWEAKQVRIVAREV